MKSNQRHKGIGSDERARIINNIKDLPNIRMTKEDMVDFPYPERPIAWIPALGEPKTGCQSCQQCRHLTKDVLEMQRHCKDKHQWTNTRRRGRQPKHLTVSTPWDEGVICQKFFASRLADKYFEVTCDRPSTPASFPIPVRLGSSPMTPRKELRRKTMQVVQQVLPTTRAANPSTQTKQLWHAY